MLTRISKALRKNLDLFNFNNMENDKVKQELRSIIEEVHQQIYYGQIERGWEVYDAFREKLYHFMNKM